MLEGMKINVYEDPYTETRPEGIATLIKKDYKLDEGFEQWLVKFDGDTEIVSRMIRCFV